MGIAYRCYAPCSLCFLNRRCTCEACTAHCNHTTQLLHALTQHAQPPLSTLLHCTQLTPACSELHNHKPATMGKPHQCRALQAALSIVEGMKAVGGQGCIGVTTGQLLCACVGSRIRAEYTVFGDSINLSARLMCKATAGMGDILCDYSTQHMATAAAAYTRLEPLVVRPHQGLMFDMTCGMQGVLVAYFKSWCCQAHPLCLCHLLLAVGLFLSLVKGKLCPADV